MEKFLLLFTKNNCKFLTVRPLSIKIIIITILDNEENAMANPTFGEKKANTDYVSRWCICSYLQMLNKTNCSCSSA